MKRNKILGMAFTVVLLISMIVPVSPAQGLNDILGGVWFKMKLSYKGYELDYSNYSVVGPASGGSTVYVKMLYDSAPPESYWTMTCSQDYNNPSLWHVAWPDNPIYSELIYGDLQIWDVYGDSWVTFNNGYATFYTDALWFSSKITTTGPVLKKASVTSFACAVWGDLGDQQHAFLGSCSLSGSSVAAEKVPSDCTK